VLAQEIDADVHGDLIEPGIESGVLAEAVQRGLRTPLPA